MPEKKKKNPSIKTLDVKLSTLMITVNDLILTVNTLKTNQKWIMAILAIVATALAGVVAKILFGV